MGCRHVIKFGNRDRDLLDADGMLEIWLSQRAALLRNTVALRHSLVYYDNICKAVIKFLPRFRSNNLLASPYCSLYPPLP